MELSNAEKALLPAPPMPEIPQADLIAKVAKQDGVSPFRQMAEMARLSWGKNKLNVDAYYSNRGEHGKARILRDVPAIVEFLRTKATYPLFGKPASSDARQRQVLRCDSFCARNV